jgi:glycosyltransferase involved in cell wall biosynthesis
MLTLPSDFRLVINAIPLLSPLTGIGQYTLHLIQELQKELFHQPALFYATGWSEELRLQPLPKIHWLKQFIQCCVPRSYPVTHYIQQQGFSAGVRGKQIHLYHEPSFVAFRFSGPTVITVHDLSYIRYRETHPIERIRYMDRYMQRSIDAAAHIIVDSDFTKREVMDFYGVSEQKITTTLLGVSPLFRRFSAEESRAILRRYGVHYGRYLLSVGTLEPRKNIAMILKAFLRLPQQLRRCFPLVVVGMQGWGTGDLLKQLNSLVLKGEVLVTGYVPRDHLPLLYSGAALFMYPSLYEGFGLPPLEAMACGAPVLAANNSSLPEVVGDAGILLDPLDDDSWFQWLQTMVEDEDLQDSYRKLALQRAQIFSWERCAQQTLLAYQQALT